MEHIFPRCLGRAGAGAVHRAMGSVDGTPRMARAGGGRRLAGVAYVGENARNGHTGPCPIASGLELAGFGNRNPAVLTDDWGNEGHLAGNWKPLLEGPDEMMLLGRARKPARAQAGRGGTRCTGAPARAAAARRGWVGRGVGWAGGGGV